MTESFFLVHLIDKDDYNGIMALHRLPHDLFTKGISRYVNDTVFIGGIEPEPEKKFGLEEEKRRQIWKEFVQAEDRGTFEAKKMYPTPDIFSRDYSQELYNVQSEKQDTLENELREKYTRIYIYTTANQGSPLSGGSYIFY